MKREGTSLGERVARVSRLSARVASDQLAGEKLGRSSVGQQADPVPAGATQRRGFILSWEDGSRDRLWALCERTALLEVVGWGRDLGPTIQFLTDEEVDVVLADLDTSPGDPAWIISILRSVLPDGRIVVWADDVTPFEALFDAGVDAWITRRAGPGTLTAAVTGRPRRFHHEF